MRIYAQSPHLRQIYRTFLNNKHLSNWFHQVKIIHGDPALKNRTHSEYVAVRLNLLDRFLAWVSSNYLVKKTKLQQVRVLSSKELADRLNAPLQAPGPYTPPPFDPKAQSNLNEEAALKFISQITSINTEEIKLAAEKIETLLKKNPKGVHDHNFFFNLIQTLGVDQFEVGLIWLVFQKKIEGYESSSNNFRVFKKEALLPDNSASLRTFDSLNAQLSFILKLKFPSAQPHFSSEENEYLEMTVAEIKQNYLLQSTKFDISSELSDESSQKVLDFLIENQCIAAWSFNGEKTYALKLQHDQKVKGWKNYAFLQREKAFESLVLTEEQKIISDNIFDKICKVHEPKIEVPEDKKAIYIEVLEIFRKNKIIFDYISKRLPSPGFRIYTNEPNQFSIEKLDRDFALSDAKKREIKLIIESLNKRTFNDPIEWKGVIEKGKLNTRKTDKILNYLVYHKIIGCFQKNRSKSFTLFYDENCFYNAYNSDWQYRENLAEFNKIAEKNEAVEDEKKKPSYSWNGLSDRKTTTLFLQCLVQLNLIRSFEYVSKKNRFKIFQF